MAKLWYSQMENENMDFQEWYETDELMITLRECMRIAYNPDRKEHHATK
jgi:hypothetical protein